MKKILKKTFGAAVILSAFAVSSAQAMTNLKGEQSHISSYAGKGKWLVVQVWKSDCKMCNTAMPDLVKFANKLPNSTVVGVTLDTNKNAINAFNKRHKVHFPTLKSSVQEMNGYLKQIADEGLTGTPTYLIYSPNGQLKAMQPGLVPAASIYNFLNQQ
ncbi:MAG: Unknown protein [uncultured Thiotrichaceae bacterium]|uniref:Thioredoxin domain-containing protein n=1 Tax=uncultured Thiotrichaceae bacterium TaxID=298394 RepID=A0A6S6U8R3_9GAMM|nr:MAG: Unknown protein [uncultured Thiotrichaceae bacterium]